MSLLNILFWLLLVLWALGIVIVSTASPNWHYINGGALLALFIIIGLRAFRTEVK
jgi:hypothetical protein